MDRDQRRRPNNTYTEFARERVAIEPPPGRISGGVFAQVRTRVAIKPHMVSGAVCAGSNPAGGAGRDIFFEYILVGPCPDGQLGRDSMNRPSTRHFMTRCHGTRPSNRLHANLFASEPAIENPLSRGELSDGPASRAA